MTIEGYQGSIREVAINGGDGLKKPHPALLDIEVRKAIAHAIDKETLVDRVLDGIGKPLETISPSANPEWVPDLSADQSLRLRPREGEADPRGRRLQGHGRRRRARDARTAASR